jgi:hypothetical protein
MFPTHVMHDVCNMYLWSLHWPLGLMCGLMPFFACIFNTCHVSISYPLAFVILIFHYIPTFISSVKHSKHFPSFSWYLDLKFIFKYLVSVFKQSCGQSKHVYILTNVYPKNWIGHYTYWMYLIWCIFHPVKTTWLCWWPS